MAAGSRQTYGDTRQDLQAAAQDLLAIGERVIGGYEDASSVVGQLAHGNFGNVEPGTGPGMTYVAQSARRLAEDLRVWRANLSSTSNAPSSTASVFEATLDTGLPMNRKERFFTGTVLPGLVTDSGFRNLHVFLKLCGLDWHESSPHGVSGIQFWTEYGFSESIFSDADRQRFEGADPAKDTPDVVLVGPDWLLAIEAKMYDWPDKGALKVQLSRQAAMVDFWMDRLGMDAARVKHIALLPDHYVQTSGLKIDQPIVTWETLVHAYEGFGPSYWLDVLRVALDRYPDLVSKTKDMTFGANSDATMTGQEIMASYTAGVIPFGCIGRQGGLHGKAFASDIATGAWQRRSYEVREDPISATNWFTVEDFAAKIDGSQLFGPV